MANGLTLQESRDQYESISSTNLIIKSTLTSLQSMTGPASQKSISQTTKTVAQPRNQQHSTSAKDQEPPKKKNFSVAKKVDKGSNKPRNEFGRKSEENELKQVFTRLQHKSAAQKTQQHIEIDEIDDSTSSSNLTSMLYYI